MFTSSSAVTASIWGLHTTELDTPIANPSGFTPLTLAQNGKLYGITSTSGASRIIVIDPKTANSVSTNYQKSTYNIVNSDGSANRPHFPSMWGITLGNLSMYTTKGILAPNGYIYYIPANAGLPGGSPNLVIPYILVLDPATDHTDCKWYYILGSSYTGIFGGGGAGYNQLFCGGVLGTDGKIYVLPSSLSNIFRFTPPAWGTQPTFEQSYYNSFTGGGQSLRNGVIINPRDQDGTQLAASNAAYYVSSTTYARATTIWGTPDANLNLLPGVNPSGSATLPDAQAAGLVVGRGGSGFSSCGLLPDGKIILTPRQKTFCFIVDPSKWNNSNVIYTSLSLWTKIWIPLQMEEELVYLQVLI